ncbi:hypothetical protein [Hymenobacter metallicola]|uniref:Uncharacterized protein n=1 Tax=Hymenobacter metallicola TaxID=2563114 RepID=A0A4Z0QJF5_9BACT|nr:hypothetical protein [Hymenobacter metallicola]TGE29399.1 hypothetical protein E5K02_08090 [Hymenobacter metallicola]
MSMTSYERLRIKHRALLSQPPNEDALRDLLSELPAQLKDIAHNRPALEEEVDHSQQQLQQIKRHMTRGQLATTESIARGVHEALAPLFPPTLRSRENSTW